MITLRRYTALLLLPLALACDKDSTGPGNIITGTFSLETVDNEALPYVLQEFTDYRYELIGLDITFNSDRSFTELATYREVDGENTITETDTDSGTYISANNAVQLRYSNGFEINGALNGNTMTVLEQGSTFVFRR